jgi:ABC-type multidrug transport system fused ATPase/permease subunit
MYADVLLAGFSEMILWWVRIYNEFEGMSALRFTKPVCSLFTSTVNGNSLERIQQYVDIDHEPEPKPAGQPPAYWPSSGDIRVEKLTARYSADGPKVLQDVSFHAKPGERIGIGEYR